MTIETQNPALSGGAAAGRGIAGAASSVWQWCKRRYHYGLAIDRLSAMSDSQLEDIGISRSEIEVAVWHGREATGQHYWESRFW